jgi:hypothetical protein
MGKKSFWMGVLAGVGVTWAYHSFVKPLPKASS